MNKISQRDYENMYPRAGAVVDGREVLNSIPNTSSISASLTDYTVLKGIREVPFSAFTQMGKLNFYSTSEKERTYDLAEQIKESGQIAPLIVVIDKEGPYILEGGHRFDALRILKAKSLPALVVLDEDELVTASLSKNSQETTKYYHITPTSSLSEIMSQGLNPSIGQRSKKLNEEAGIFLFHNQGVAEDALYNWLADEFEEDEPLAMLEINLPLSFVNENVVVDKAMPGVASICKSNIPPRFVKILLRDDFKEAGVSISRLDKTAEHELMQYKLIRTQEGNIYRKYENDEFYAKIVVSMFLNGKEWMPEINVGVIHKASNRRVLAKGVYMSKREFAEGMGRVNNGVFENKQAMFKDYVRQHQEKYQKQMPSIFKEAKVEMEEKAKQSVQEQGLIVGSGLDSLKGFIETPSMASVQILWNDIKDKGYIRLAKRGRDRGLLIPDMKAINRIILSREFMDKPATISALIAKQASDELKRWSRWGVSWSLNFDIGWWSDEMAKLFGIEKDNYDGKNAFRKKANQAIDFYTKQIVDIVNLYNTKAVEDRKKNEEAAKQEPVAELPQPNVIDVEDDE